jgi:hypothetical protein
LIIHVSFRRTSSSSAIQLAFKRGFITKETYTWLTCSQQLIPRLDVEHRRLCGESPTRIRSRSNHRPLGPNVRNITLRKYRPGAPGPGPPGIRGPQRTISVRWGEGIGLRP